MKKVDRLFEQFQPKHYALLLHPDGETMRFTGKVVIRGQKTGQPSKRLTFHQRGLKVTSAQIVRHDKKGDQQLPVTRVNHHKSFYQVRLHTESMAYPGAYTITLEFEGLITQAMNGIYPCFFKHNGQNKVILATQFESDHAREAFPCIDEPEAKATFQLTLVTSETETVLANTPVEKQSTISKQQTTIFEVTPRMSTYLLAFVSGDLHCVEKTTKDGIAVRSWASVAQPLSHLEYAAEEAVRALEFFTGYFGVPYPLSKCDHVALPDFDSGAMENWGLITYRESVFLTDPANPSISSQQLITLVVVHELSHQWFGNLVTMKWWDDLWLNESFAGLMEHIGADALHPEWHQWELYTVNDVITISARDVYKDIQPVGVDVTDPDLIETLFDPGIVYAKGARLLKMLREHISDEAFIKGLRSYFKKHAYGNATREDLWTAFGEASGDDVPSLMSPWLTQSGMPIVHVTQDGIKLKLEQERFLLDGESDGRTWPIPLLTNQPVQPTMFRTTTAEAVLNSPDYVIINATASGDYFTHYAEPAHRAYLAKVLRSGAIPAETRINILNDMYMLARRGDAPITDALDVIRNLGQEPRDSVWGSIGRVVGAAGLLTEGNKGAEKQLNALRAKLGQYWYKQLDWDDKPGDDSNTKQLRHTAAAFMVAGEDNSAISKALQVFRQAATLDDIQAELRGTVLAAAVRHGNDPMIIKQLIETYEMASPDLQSDITFALASTRDKKVAKDVLNKAVGSAGFVRSQDVLRWLVAFLRNYYIREEAWQFIVDQWDWLESTLGASKSFDYLPTYCAGVINTEEWAEKYKKLFESKRQVKALQQNIKVGYGDIAARIAWRQRDEKLISEWLANHFLT